MAKAKKKYPEFELPPLIVNAIQTYLGPTGVGKLTSKQRREITSIAQDAASEIGGVLFEPAPATQPADDAA